MSCVAAGSRKRKAHGELLEFENVVKHSVEATSVSDAGQNLATQVDMVEAFTWNHFLCLSIFLEYNFSASQLTLFGDHICIISPWFLYHFPEASTFYLNLDLVIYDCKDKCGIAFHVISELAFQYPRMVVWLDRLDVCLHLPVFCFLPWLITRIHKSSS